MGRSSSSTKKKKEGRKEERKEGKNKSVEEARKEGRKERKKEEGRNRGRERGQTSERGGGGKRIVATINEVNSTKICVHRSVVYCPSSQGAQLKTRTAKLLGRYATLLRREELLKLSSTIAGLFVGAPPPQPGQAGLSAPPANMAKMRFDLERRRSFFPPSLFPCPPNAKTDRATTQRPPDPDRPTRIP